MNQLPAYGFQQVSLPARTSRSLALPPGTSFRANKQRIRRRTRKPKGFEGAAWWRGWPAGWARANGKLHSRQVHPNPEGRFHDATPHPVSTSAALPLRRPARHSPFRRPQGRQEIANAEESPTRHLDREREVRGGAQPRALPGETGGGNAGHSRSSPLAFARRLPSLSREGTGAGGSL